MKSILAWIFVIQFATGHNLVGELLRMPLLLDHYKIHQIETPGLSVRQFLWMHYCNTQHEQSDSRHARLPLHCEHVLLADSTVPCEIRFEHNTHPPVDEASNALLISDEFLKLSPPLSGIFRPPLA